MDWCRLFKAGSAAARGTIIALGLVTAGCATVGAPRTAEQDVVERAQGKWDALVKGNIGAAYRYLSPGSRAVVSEQAFKDSIRPGFWKGATVEKAVCAGPESCEAYATIEYEVRGGRIKTPLTETWIKQDGEWWFVQK